METPTTLPVSSHLQGKTNPSMVFLPIAVYSFAPGIAEGKGVNLGVRREIPHRNDYTFFLEPWKCNDKSPQLFAENAMASVEPDAVIIADGTTVYPLWYEQEVKGVRKDVDVLSSHGGYVNAIKYPTAETFRSLYEQRPVYVVTPVQGYSSGFIIDKCDFVVKGAVYRAIPKL